LCGSSFWPNTDVRCVMGSLPLRMSVVGSVRSQECVVAGAEVGVM